MYKTNELTGHQSFESTFTHEGVIIDVVITQSALHYIEDKNMSLYEITSDVALSAEDALDLASGSVYAVTNPFMNTSLVASIQTQGDGILISVIRVFDYIKDEYRGTVNVFGLDGVYGQA